MRCILQIPAERMEDPRMARPVDRVMHLLRLKDRMTTWASSRQTMMICLSEK